MSFKDIEKLCQKYDISLLGKNIGMYIKEILAKYSKDIEVKKEDTFIPDKAYVCNIIKNFNEIKNVLPQNLQYRFIKDMTELIDDDFDDGIEIMKSINAILNDCIMKGYTKVKTENIEVLDKFLKDMGYEEVEVDKNCLISDYSRYFKNAFPEITESYNCRGKIRTISIKPFEMNYYDEELSENIALILLGECSYYK